ncbi:neutral metalloprotease [Macrococcus sp. DPC7161]|uniref:M30 family zinc metallopeptidase n=1 Tax=Macrococcus sp. DPC7161 TaxID=2507060 RepID=UPI00100BA58A|nr:neutral metalloprotease [Macrococcus sp. DPC7161]RXK17437.1 neutral metalloprotease [Macrococcus sp. DPC7161]
MKKIQKFTTCIAALAIAAPLAVADAKTYVINNSNSDKLGSSEVLGDLPSALVTKNNSILGDYKKSKDIHQIDKNFDIPKVSKDKITQSKAQIPNLVEDYQVGDTRDFTTINMVTNADEKTKATLQYDGSKAQIWVADSRVTKEKAEQIGKEFDQNIGPVVEKYFSTPSDIDKNGKINILVFDIKDDFEKTGSYVGGYFHPRDLLMMNGSNMSETFYMDTFPSMGKNGEMDVTKIYTTLAHEYQHMVNFNRNILVEKGDFIDGKMDTWLNEAFSMASEQIYSKQPLTKRIEYFNKSESIANGHSLIKWQNNNDVLSNYSLSYLFGQYLRTQADNGDAIFKEILEDQGTTIETLQNAIHKHVSPTMSVDQFMTNFRVALVKKDKSGPYGFKGEAGFDQINPIHITNLPESLMPQGAVVFDAKDDFKVPSNKGQHIQYVDISGAASEEPTGETPTGEEPTAEEPTGETPTAETPEPCPNGDLWCPGNYPR